MSPVGGIQLTLALKPLILCTVDGGGTDVGTKKKRSGEKKIIKIREGCKKQFNVNDFF